MTFFCGVEVPHALEGYASAAQSLAGAIKLVRLQVQPGGIFSVCHLKILRARLALRLRAARMGFVVLAHTLPRGVFNWAV